MASAEVWSMATSVTRSEGSGAGNSLSWSASYGPCSQPNPKTADATPPASRPATAPRQAVRRSARLWRTIWRRYRRARMKAGRTLPIYLSAGAFFAAIAARGFLVPLRAHELGADRFQVGLLFSLATFAGAFMALRAALAVTTVMYLLPLALSPLISGAGAAVRSWDLVTPLREMGRKKGFPAAVLALFGATLIWGTVQAYLPLFGKEVLGLS